MGKEARIAVEIVGVEPGLLMHRFDMETEAGLMKSSGVVAKAKEPPGVDAEKAAYRLEDGRLYQPAEHIFQAMRRAASNTRIQGQGKKTFKDRVQGLLVITPEYIPHVADNGGPRKEYEIDSRPVRIQRARIVRHRPRLPEWRLKCQFLITDVSLLPVDVAETILIDAGNMQGIGDYRPRFGRFRVAEFKEV